MTNYGAAKWRWTRVIVRVRRRNGHDCDKVTPDVRAPFRSWSLSFFGQSLAAAQAAGK
jgi:hypothetical protein